MKKRFIILGGTGSIGSQTLDIIRENNDELIGFSFNKNITLAEEIIKEFHPQYVCCMDEDTKKELLNKFKDIEVLIGINGLKELVSKEIQNEYIINALVGSVGLIPSYQVVSLGKNLYLANKETLVIGGELINKKCAETGSKIIPIDSEHSSIYQILKGKNHQEINKLYITASGGAFRDYSLDELKDVTINQALNHPNWKMGKKITIDCATMMNKGFELIEAHYLFNMPMEKIIPVLHKESIIHAAVEFKDYSIQAVMSKANMRQPIEYAIYGNHENHCKELETLNLFGLNLSFQELDENRYQLLVLTKEVMKKGGYYPTILNAVNEVAVNKFLNQEISFLEIEKMIKEELSNSEYDQYQHIDLTIDGIFELDQKIKNKYGFY